MLINKSLFTISKMDCPCEENLIRMKLAEITGIERLDFDLAKRELTVFHHGEINPIESIVLGLNLGGIRVATEQVSLENADNNEQEKANAQHKSLWIVLAINFAFFVIEMTTGLISSSMGLVADSLDMLADSFVYGISLLAVGATAISKKRIAKLAGYFQLMLAMVGFIEVLRRFFGVENLPNFSMMIGVSVLALIANTICLYVLQGSKGKDEAHIQASMIFTSNDVIINLGVIVAGSLVYVLNSHLPDLIIGSIVFVLVVQGALRILKLGR